MLVAVFERPREQRAGGIELATSGGGRLNEADDPASPLSAPFASFVFEGGAPIGGTGLRVDESALVAADEVEVEARAGLEVCDLLNFAFPPFPAATVGPPARSVLSSRPALVLLRAGTA